MNSNNDLSPYLDSPIGNQGQHKQYACTVHMVHRFSALRELSTMRGCSVSCCSAWSGLSVFNPMAMLHGDLPWVSHWISLMPLQCGVLPPVFGSYVFHIGRKRKSLPDARTNLKNRGIGWMFPSADFW